MMTNATMAGLDLRVVDATGPGSAAAAGEPAPIVILLHGFSMRADDLAPFGASLGLPALFLFPEGPIDLGPVGLPGRAWWMIDVASRDDDIAQGRQRDLGREAPAGLPAANRALGALVGEVLARWPERPLFLGGFSQGAILSLDLTLRTRPPLAGVILLSSGRVTIDAWVPLMKNVGNLPMFQSHGRQDRELSFSAAQALAADLATAGASHTFLPFEGGHEIPLPVLRALKKFVRTVAQANNRGR